MKHLNTVSRRPSQASDDPTPGQILTLVTNILSVIATALVSKEGGSTTTT